MILPASLPSSVDAERLTLGAIFGEPERFHDVAALLSAEDFFDARHARVFGAIAALLDDGGTVNDQTVRLKLGPSFSEIGAEYLAELVYQAVDPEALDTYARTIREMAIRRESMRTFANLAALGANLERSTESYLEQAEADVYRVLGRRAGVNDHRPLATVVEALEHESDRIADGDVEMPGIPTGIPSLDRVTRGLRPGHLVLIGGGTSDGKSALAGTIAKHAAERGFRGAVFTMEMPTEDWVRRLVAADGIIQSDQDSRAFLQDPSNRQRLRDARARVAELPLHFVDKPGITFPQIRSWCRRLAARAPLDFVIVDYLDLMGSHDKFERHDLDLGARAKCLMMLAGEMKCPVVLLVQLNREAARDAGNGPKRKPPELRHIAGSFEVARHAHLVLLIHAPNATDSSDGDDGTREIVVAKSRNGLRYRRIRTKLIGERFTFVEQAPPGFEAPQDPRLPREDDDRAAERPAPTSRPSRPDSFTRALGQTTADSEWGDA